jgi:hypothetical protein
MLGKPKAGYGCSLHAAIDGTYGLGASDKLIVDPGPHGYPERHFARVEKFSFSLRVENHPDFEEIRLKLEEHEKRTIVLVKFSLCHERERGRQNLYRLSLRLA